MIKRINCYPFLVCSTWYLFSSLIIQRPLNDTNQNSLYKLGYVEAKKGDSLIKFINNIQQTKKYPIQRNKTSLNPTKQELSTPYSSAQNINPKIGLLIVVVFLTFILFVIIKVRQLMKSEKN